MIVFGFIILAVSGYFGFREYQIITTGEEVNAVVSKIIEVKGDDGVTYKPEFTYRLNNANQIYTPSFSSSSNRYVVGDPQILLVSDKGISIKGIHAGIIAMGIGILVGLIFFIIGITWSYRHQKHFDEVARIKRVGIRVQARFIKKDSTSYTVNGQTGNTFFFQEEGGEQRIFQTKPIFSEFSIKWLEEHSFDVYVDPRNSTKYFIDIEKHFGHPQPHN